MAWQLGMLRDYIADPSDWVVAADVDELQDWGGKFLKCAPRLLACLLVCCVRLRRPKLGGWAVAGGCE